MVVVAIIGILASVLFVSFSDARDSSRNQALSTEVKSVQLAIELYKAQNGRYPAVVNDLLPQFITDLPEDTATCTFVYNVYDTEGTTYKYAGMNCLIGVDASTGMSHADELALCPAFCDGTGGENTACADTLQPDFYQSLAVYSFGAECR